jgi:hypothetical protein
MESCRGKALRRVSAGCGVRQVSDLEAQNRKFSKPPAKPPFRPWPIYDVRLFEGSVSILRKVTFDSVLTAFACGSINADHFGIDFGQSEVGLLGTLSSKGLRLSDDVMEFTIQWKQHQRA